MIIVLAQQNLSSATRYLQRYFQSGGAGSMTICRYQKFDEDLTTSLESANNTTIFLDTYLGKLD